MPGLVLEALGWTSLALAAALALLPFPVVIPPRWRCWLAITAIAAAWARLGGSAGGGDASPVCCWCWTLWLGGRWLGPGWPALAAPAAALLLSLAPHRRPPAARGGAAGGLGRLPLFPLALADAVIAHRRAGRSLRPGCWRCSA